jgi:uncharacterized protein DUF4231
VWWKKKPDPYLAQLRQDFGDIINDLDLGPMEKRFLKGRWLDQLLWFEKKSTLNQKRYYVLRLATIVGGVIVPAVVSLNVHGHAIAEGAAWTAFGLSLIVAIAAAVEGFFRYGERWRTFRRTAEGLKAQAWQYFQLAGPYKDYKSHRAGFPAFAAQVELLVQQDVEAFIAQQNQAQGAQASAQTTDAPPGTAPSLAN